MKTLLFLCLTFLLSFASLSAQNEDCARYRHGKFLHVEDGVAIGTVTRRGNLQIERYDDVKVVLKIKWISDCEYELRLKGGNHAWKAESRGMPNDEVIYAKITNSTSLGFWVRAKVVGAEDDTYRELKFILAKK